MATDNKKRITLPLASGDFESNKAAIKEFLKSQAEFSDYNFDGSAMSLLLSILSYDNYQKAFYLNQVGNEGFLSTAIRRDSVVARAKDLGYTPRSKKAAVASVNLLLTASSVTDDSILIPKSTKFSSGDVIFNTIRPYSAFRQADGTFVATDVSIFEGKSLTYTKVIDETTISGITIPNIGVDTSTIEVFVQKAGASSFVKYDIADDIVSLASTSVVYYLDEVEGMKHRIYFGDDVISSAVGIGDTVRIEYISTNGVDGNGYRSFDIISSISGVDTYSVIPLTQSTGGSDIESIESIKLAAPRRRETQKRAITPLDYEDLIRQIYPNASDVKAIGGEKLSPPKFGKVAVFVKPITGNFLNDKEKRDLVQLIQQYSVILSSPIILDPEYTYINVQSNVEISSIATSVTEADLRQRLIAGIEQYSVGIENFNSVFYGSNLVSFIDTFDPAIVSNDTTFFVEKRIVPELNRLVPYELNMECALVECTLRSSEFSFDGLDNCFFADNCGTLQLFQNQQSGTVLVNSDVGTVDNLTGKVKINTIKITGIPENDFTFDVTSGDYFFKFQAQTKGSAIGKGGNSILKIGSKNINVTRIVGR